jgi:branched-chain amino acid transport system substrate-binding protein
MSVIKWMVHLGIAAALSFSAPAAIAQTNAIKLDASVQLTGSLANTGRHYRDASLSLEISERGGVRLDGEVAKLKLVILDNQSDTNLSVRQYVQIGCSREGETFFWVRSPATLHPITAPIAEKYPLRL